MSTKNQPHRGILLESGNNEVEFLRFTVGGQTYGINVSKVCQALLLSDLVVTSLPGGHPSIEGSVYFRGKPIPVINLRTFFGLEEQVEENSRPLLLVTEFNRYISGFIIDKVEGVVRISWGEFTPMDMGIMQKADADVVGTVTIGETIILILDVEAMLGKMIPSLNISSYTHEVTENDTQREEIRILYCEDSPLVQKVTLETLKGAGFEKIKVFTSGADGLNFVNNHNRDEIDIILSDIEMPQMDGLTFCRLVKENPSWSNVPFVFFSSMINEQMKIKCNSVGGNAAFSKPEIQHIVSAIDDLVGKRK